VVSESVPPPLTDQVTPSLFLSFSTEAVRVAVSVGSTVEAEAVTVRLTGFELPPQPANRLATKRQGTVKAPALKIRKNDPLSITVLSSSDHILTRTGEAGKHSERSGRTIAQTR
jgi:hypothetical protein